MLLPWPVRMRRLLKGLNVYRHVLFIINYYKYVLFLFFFIFRCPRRAGANEKNRIGLLFPAAAVVSASTDPTNRGATIAADAATVRTLWYSRQAPRRPHTHTYTRVRSYVVCYRIVRLRRVSYWRRTWPKKKSSPSALAKTSRGGSKHQRFTRISYVYIYIPGIDEQYYMCQKRNLFPLFALSRGALNVKK